MREGVGLMDISGFSKFEVTGPGAEAWLDRVLACRMPSEGRMALAPMLNARGRMAGDLTVSKLGEGRFFLAGSGAAEEAYMRHFERLLPADGSVRVEAASAAICGLSIAGPKARDLLAAVTGADVSHAAFPFMAIRALDVGYAPCRVGRVSYTGDLGYEIWMRTDMQRHVFERLVGAGTAFGLKLFGLRALNSLRLEKNWASWGREYRPIYGPLEAGLDRFVAYGKEADFIGKAGALKERETGGKLRLVSFVVDADDADVIADEPIYFEGDVRGWVTSGGYAHNQGVSMAMGYVPKEIADAPEGWQIEILGDLRGARLQPTPLFDPNGARMRS